jgi:hypothetical protein
MTYIEKIVDSSTGEIINNPYSKEQLAELKTYANLAITEQLEAKANAQAKASLLTKLGITADEAKLLLS